jgi:hypothetical protein
MEYIYFAVSDSHPGMVKIGRTDREISERMSEISYEDYGLSSFEGDSSWQAVEVFTVADNVKAERILHEHFNSVRVENGREIFYSDDVSDMAKEAADIVDGSSIDLIAALEENTKLNPTEGNEIIELILMLGVAGIGFPVAAILYAKYKDEKVVKDAIKKLKFTFDEGSNKWNGSAAFRKNLLKKYKYPPDEQKDAVEMVLRQAEVISEDALAA